MLRLQPAENYISFGHYGRSKGDEAAAQKIQHLFFKSGHSPAELRGIKSSFAEDFRQWGGLSPLVGDQTAAYAGAAVGW